MKIPVLSRAETKAKVLKGLDEVSKHLIDCNDLGELPDDIYNELQSYIQAAIHEIK